MRIWSIHPKYLDAKGLVALWRETLLAKKVLERRTKGYTNHPQLIRFKALPDPISGINQYLSFVFDEAQNRQYQFDQSKFKDIDQKLSVPVTEGQVRYEFEHLLKKLQTRDPARYEALKQVTEVELHPLFAMVAGPVENWEVII